MSERPTRWIRHRPDRAQNRLALGAGLAAGLAAGMIVGGAVFYFARLFVAREAIGSVPGGAVAVGSRGEEREER